MAASSFNDEDGAVLSDINVVPLVDVVLVLLIVFMITVPQIVGSAHVKVDLPETSSTELSNAEDLPLHIYLRREDSGEIGLYLNETRTTEDKLKSMLAQSYGGAKEKPPASVAADKGISYGEVTKVMEVLISLGMRKIALDTKHVAK